METRLQRLIADVGRAEVGQAPESHG